MGSPLVSGLLTDWGFARHFTVVINTNMSMRQICAHPGCEDGLSSSSPQPPGSTSEANTLTGRLNKIYGRQTQGPMAGRAGLVCARKSRG